MSFKRLVTFTALLAVFTMAVRFSIGADTYWHLRAGDWIVSKGSILRTDPFSLTRLDSEWVYPGWASQVLLISIYRVLGYPGLNLLTALAVAAAFGFVWKTMQGGPLVRAFVLLLAATASAVYWSARPHIFTLLLTAITLWALAKFRREGSRVIWIIPLLTAAWANVHGGFVVAILLVMLEIVAALTDLLLPKLRIAIAGNGAANGSEQHGPTISAHEGGVASPEPQDGSASARQEDGSEIWVRLRTLIAVGAVSIAAILLNPHGPEMLVYPFRTVSIEVLQRYVQEWQSPDFHMLEVQPFLWLLLITLMVMALSPKRPTAIELLHLIIFGYLAFLAARNIALFALVAAPVLSRHLAGLVEGWKPVPGTREDLPKRITRPLNILLLVLLSVLTLIKVNEPLSPQFNVDAIREGMPAEAVEVISSNKLAGPLFNSYNWGGYILWSLYPEYLSFVDGRTDLFDDEILDEYLSLWLASEGWQESLAGWGVNVVVVERDAPLARELAENNWEVVHRDEKAIVLTRPES